MLRIIYATLCVLVWLESSEAIGGGKEESTHPWMAMMLNVEDGKPKFCHAIVYNRTHILTRKVCIEENILTQQMVIAQGSNAFESKDLDRSTPKGDVKKTLTSLNVYGQNCIWMDLAMAKVNTEFSSIPNDKTAHKLYQYRRKIEEIKEPSKSYILSWGTTQRGSPTSPRGLTRLQINGILDCEDPGKYGAIGKSPFLKCLRGEATNDVAFSCKDDIGASVIIDGKLVGFLIDPIGVSDNVTQCIEKNQHIPFLLISPFACWARDHGKFKSCQETPDSECCAGKMNTLIGLVVGLTLFTFIQGMRSNL